MSITYPPEMLPRAEEDGADVVIVGGMPEWDSLSDEQRESVRVALDPCWEMAIARTAYEDIRNILGHKPPQ